MKKSKTMRAATLLLALTLITTCFIGGTFGRYTTSDFAIDQARVTKFGVTLQVDGFLFGNHYDSTNLPVVAGTDNLTVNVDDHTLLTEETGNVNTEDMLVAPGTKNNSGFGFSLNGKPEVAVNLDATIIAQEIFLAAGSYAQAVEAGVNATSFKANTYYVKAGTTYTLAESYTAGTTYYTMEDMVTTNAKYFPVVFTAAGDGAASFVCTDDSLNQIAAAYAKALNGNVAVAGSNTISTDGKVTYTITDKYYAPNTDLSALGLSGENITWEWAYQEDTTIVVTSSEAANIGNTEAIGNDAADTILGLLIDPATATNVVKLTGENTYGALTEYTDYCLETGLTMIVTVTQVD